MNIEELPQEDDNEFTETLYETENLSIIKFRTVKFDPIEGSVDKYLIVEKK